MNETELPLVSIVVLNFNGLEFLKQTVTPIENLSYPNKEIIYVDNASIDGSVEYLKQFKNIQIVENKNNEGFNKGKNIGIQHAKGDYVLSLDGDILIQNTDIIEKLLQCATKDTGLIQLPLFDVDKDRTKYYGIYFAWYGINRNIPWASKEEILKLPGMVPIGSATGACLFFKRDVWNKLEGLDESQVYHLDESDIGPRFSIYGYKNYLYTQRILIHLGVKHAASLKLYARRYLYLFSGEGRSILKNYSFWDTCACLTLFIFYQLIKSVRFALLKRNLSILKYSFSSVYIFISNLPQTLILRRKIQIERSTPADIFLKIKPPRLL